MTELRLDTEDEKLISPDRLLNCFILLLIVASVVSGAVLFRFGGWAIAFAALSGLVCGATSLYLLARVRSGKVGRTDAALELKKAELASERLALGDTRAQTAAILENMVDGVIIIDARGTVLVFSPAAQRIFDYQENEVVGNTVNMLMPKQEAGEHNGNMSRYHHTGQAKIIGIGREVRGQRKDGTIFPLQLAIGEISKGNETVFVGTIHDLTDRNEHEEIIRHAQKMQAIGQLTGGIAHDFNNLLASIIIDLELAAEKMPDGGEARVLVRDAIASAKRGASLNQGLLAFSRKQHLSPQSIDLRQQLDRVLEILQRTLGEIIEIDAHTASDLWLCHADADQVENALLNLAINARDAMPGGGKLTIDIYNARLSDHYTAAKIEVEPGEYVVVALTDNGVGMPQDVLDRAFEPFFTTKPVGQGTGLGLSSIYGFAKQTGGNLTIYSEEGEGTTIKFYIPRSSGESDAETTPVDDNAPRGDGELVLLVEDDEYLRRAARRSLDSLGYQVREAASGQEALDLVREDDRLDILLTDVVLGGDMSGPDLAWELKKQIPDLNILFMSGYTDRSVVHQGKLDAGHKLLNKPFTKSELAQAIRTALSEG